MLCSPPQPIQNFPERVESQIGFFEQKKNHNKSQRYTFRTVKQVSKSSLALLNKNFGDEARQLKIEKTSIRQAMLYFEFQ